MKKLVRRARKLADPYRVSDGKRFRLKDVDPADTGALTEEDKPRAREALRTGVEVLARLQNLLWAQDRWALLLIFQGMDAAGKDGAIAHVMSGVNPQGCEVHAFKAPSPEEHDHDYLWRAHVRLPRRGRIGIFNRSYYEEVLVVRVHREILAGQKLPRDLLGKDVWDERFEDIRSFERYLARNGVVIRKFFLHLSREEQKRRFLERLEDPVKNWKFSPADVRERAAWDDYMAAYEDAIRHTATAHAPWYVVPADHKWFTRAVIAAAIVDALASLDLEVPTIDKAKRLALEAARRALLAERRQGRAVPR
jgi:PPK2 family polyphosphate:nucleotide phosphotransferase